MLTAVLTVGKRYSRSGVKLIWIIPLLIYLQEKKINKNKGISISTSSYQAVVLSTPPLFTTSLSVMLRQSVVQKGVTKR